MKNQAPPPVFVIINVFSMRWNGASCLCWRSARGSVQDCPPVAARLTTPISLHISHRFTSLNAHFHHWITWRIRKIRREIVYQFSSYTLFSKLNVRAEKGHSSQQCGYTFLLVRTRTTGPWAPLAVEVWKANKMDFTNISSHFITLKSVHTKKKLCQ